MCKVELKRAFSITSLLLIVGLWLSACSGFALRTPQSPLIKPLNNRVIVIKGDINAPMRLILERVLQENGGIISDGKASDGVVNLTLERFDEGKTVSAYSSERQIREFNHFIELAFTAYRLPSSQEADRITDEVRAERLQTYDSRFVLGSTEEESLILQELREEVARLLAIRLKAVPGI